MPDRTGFTAGPDQVHGSKSLMLRPPVRKHWNAYSQQSVRVAFPNVVTKLHNQGASSSQSNIDVSHHLPHRLIGLKKLGHRRHLHSKHVLAMGTANSRSEIPAAARDTSRARSADWNDVTELLVGWIQVVAHLAVRIQHEHAARYPVEHSVTVGPGSVRPSPRSSRSHSPETQPLCQLGGLEVERDPFDAFLSAYRRLRNELTVHLAYLPRIRC